LQKIKLNLLLTLVFVVVLISSVYPEQLLANEKIGEITGSVVNVRNGPGTQYAVISKVSQGQFVTILDEKNNWFRVKLAAGQTGWIAGWLINDQLDSLEAAVVSGDVVNIRQGPGITFAKINQVKAGDKLTILKSEEKSPEGVRKTIKTFVSLSSVPLISDLIALYSCLN